VGVRESSLVNTRNSIQLRTHPPEETKGSSHLVNRIKKQ
jgi:hypothetical protein